MKLTDEEAVALQSLDLLETAGDFKPEELPTEGMTQQVADAIGRPERRTYTRRLPHEPRSLSDRYAAIARRRAWKNRNRKNR
jgi:hypothetical protein